LVMRVDAARGVALPLVDSGSPLCGYVVSREMMTINKRLRAELTN
jgi:hypothetical protein